MPNCRLVGEDARCAVSSNCDKRFGVVIAADNVKDKWRLSSF